MAVKTNLDGRLAQTQTPRKRAMLEGERKNVRGGKRKMRYDGKRQGKRR